MNRIAIFALVVAGIALPGSSQAKPGFPSQIQQHLGLDSEPTCLICHGSKQGGGPITQPFGLAMLDAGLTSLGNASLTSALDKLEADKTDSNADGVPDIEGLRQHILPLASKDPIEYGCGGNTIARGGNVRSSTSMLVLVGLVLLGGSRVRRSTQAHGSSGAGHDVARSR